MQKTEDGSGERILRCCKAALLGGLIALAGCILFLLIASIGVSQGLLSPDLRYQLTVVGCVLGGFLGAMLMAGRCPAQGVFTGLAVGGVLFLLLLTLGFLMYDSASFTNGGLGLLCGALCGGAAGGILHGGGKKKAKRKRRSRSSR